MSSKCSLATKSEPCQCFNAPLSALSTSQIATNPPHPYCPGLTPQPSPLHPHCLAKECLRLPKCKRWRKQVNCILEVLGALWAKKTKEVYGTGLLTYHIYCNECNLLETQHVPITANNLLMFLSSCTRSYSSPTLANFTAGLQAWHLLHGLQWHINPEELRAILEEPFRIDMLKLLHSLMDPENHRDAAIFACITIVFYSMAHLGEFMVQSIKQFNPLKHITCVHVMHLHVPNGLPTSTAREDTQCAPVEGVTNPIRALEHHLWLNPADPNAHLFAWKHPTSGMHLLSRSEVIKHITMLTAALNLPNFKGHSLRIGGTLHYLLCGMPFDVVKTISRWARNSFTLYLCQHAMILAPYLNDMPALLEHFTRYTMPPVH
ncbi:hypothetical protein EDC04DRAFT_2943070 [Pisolithus marmoratus]|nr:hypothetical protein EDC04DRAFT_2943070 [Pisolithus marmoratus]